MPHLIRFQYQAAIVALVLAGAGAGSGCKAAERQRPIEMGPVDTGPGSLTYVRRQLEGSWDLVALEVRNKAGQMTPTKAQALLTYDAYGNMNVRGKLLDPLPDATAKLASSAVDYSGKIVIDTVKSEFRMTEQNAQQPLDRDVQNILNLSRVRRYELSADTLKIHVMDQGNAVVATTTFRKVS